MPREWRMATSRCRAMFVMLVECIQMQILNSGRYAVCRLFVAPDDLEEMVRTADRHDLTFHIFHGAPSCRICEHSSRCTREGAFTRLAAELESGYLGQDWTECLCLSVFGYLDNFANILFLMEPHLKTCRRARERHCRWIWTAAT